MNAWTTGRRRLVAVLVVALVVAVGVGTALLGRTSSPPPSGPAGHGALEINVTGPFATLAPTFWGINVVPQSAPSTSMTRAVESSPVAFVRYPGGLVGERLNLSSNVLVNDVGSGYTPPFGLAEFVPWCRSIHCRAVLELPAEIDDPASAAFQVHYTESVLGFRPDFWEIGNEPATWNHFGIPWSRWNASQHLNATPGEFATLVGAYARAVHAIDPAARLIGLGGVGTGASNELAWLRAVAGADGAELSGLAIHVYPASTGATTGTGGLADFLGTLEGGASLPARFVADQRAVQSACPACSNLSLWVTELGSANASAPFAPGLLNGSVQAVYIAAEIVQAVELGVPQVDEFALASATWSSWFDATGSPRPVGSLYTGVLGALGTGVYPTHFTGDLGGVYAAALSTPTGGGVAVLIVNANASSALDLSLVVPGLRWSPEAFLLPWNSSAAAPANATRGVPDHVVIPAASILLVDDPGATPALFLDGPLFAPPSGTMPR
ncbi:MAG: hypothetical protein ACREDK_05035 [Thermoplasmata archaeon]